MEARAKKLVELENKFWQSIVDEDTSTALLLLDEPALMVSTHGAMKFDHAAYKRMAEQGSVVVKSYALSDVDVVFATDDTAVLTYKVKQVISPRGKSEQTTQQMADSSTWVRKGDEWRCVMHTETALVH